MKDTEKMVQQVGSSEAAAASKKANQNEKSEYVINLASKSSGIVRINDGQS